MGWGGIGKALSAVNPVAAISTVGQAGLDIWSARQANRQAEASSAKQMEFQERMSNTSYRRGVEDLRAAGLNPMLAYSQGGASSPGGAQYSPESIAKGAISGAVSTALETRRTMAELGLVKAQEREANSRRNKTDLESKIVESQIPTAYRRSALDRAIMEPIQKAIDVFRNSQRRPRHAGEESKWKPWPFKF